MTWPERHTRTLASLRERWPDDVWAIGQLTHAERLALRWAERRALVRRERVLWPWVTTGFIHNMTAF